MKPQQLSWVKDPFLSMGDAMALSNDIISERLALIAQHMEEALVEEHIDRFHELSKQRSRDLHALLERRRKTLSNLTANDKTEIERVEDLLTRAVHENQRMLCVARQRLCGIRQKIDNLIDRKTAHQKLGRRYNKLLDSGHLFSYSS